MGAVSEGAAVKCKHAVVDNGYNYARIGPSNDTPAVLIEYARKICLECGAWLSLGPSDDTPAVLIEIRAAELATDNVSEYDDLEWAGFSGEEQYFAGGSRQMRPIDFKDPRWQAGYLADSIENHEDGE